MAQIEKLGVQTQIKSSGDKFYENLRSKAYLIPKICPEIVKDIQVLQGDWETMGSVRLWTYVAGNCEKLKETVEAVDDKTRSITFKMLEGEIVNYYKTYKPTLQVTTMGQVTLAKWTVEYEKNDEHIPPPHRYLELLHNLNKAIDAYLPTSKA
ncbi:hypothetical protein P3X46_026570 [Hevea brasiliensis]|uniref:Bet v I/Major latex protein domain-containing protein n=1 Tax=Hevea brasiliensis TaxID=3981 RepID=A0ABQ9KZA7_HEVBR|nr:kirola-like [Hevea brasiliensis]KAJ9153086.1 hypothetical protein P3X46_026570 [Hevea brasiliensis]